MVEKPLYRYFNKKEYCESSLKGLLRLSTFDYYRHTEDDNRRDEEEGMKYTHIEKYSASKSKPKTIETLKRVASFFDVRSDNFTLRNTEVGEIVPDAYLLCLSKTSKLSHFGKYCIEIRKPQDYFILLSKALIATLQVECTCIYDAVKYDVRHAGFREELSNPRNAFFLKDPKKFSHEEEVRMCWMPKTMGIVRQPLKEHVFIGGYPPYNEAFANFCRSYCKRVQ